MSMRILFFWLDMLRRSRKLVMMIPRSTTTVARGSSGTTRKLLSMYMLGHSKSGHWHLCWRLGKAFGKGVWDLIWARVWVFVSKNRRLGFDLGLGLGLKFLSIYRRYLEFGPKAIHI